jgi:hypothetical protein
LADFSNISVTGATSGSTTAGSAKADTPDVALRRLHLPEPTGESYGDVVKLDSTDLRNVATQIDAQRVELERSHNLATQALTVLAAMQDTLNDVADRQKQNATPGTSKQTRRENQTKIDAALKEIDDALKAAGTETEQAFAEPGTTLRAGQRSLKIDPLSLDTLGRITRNGKTVSLGDLARRGPLDTTRRKRTVQEAARQSIADAQAQVTALKDKLTTFETDIVRPRVSDVATAMEGIYDSTVGGLGSTDEALDTARKLRKLMLNSATAAVAVGAEGWDRERVIGLLT